MRSESGITTVYRVNARFRGTLREAFAVCVIWLGSPPKTSAAIAALWRLLTDSSGSMHLGMAPHLGHVSNFHRTKRVVVEPMKPLAFEKPADSSKASVLYGHPDRTRLELPVHTGCRPLAKHTAHPVKESSIMKRDTKFKPGVSGNETAKWGPGQSGNPAGKSRGRARFEEAFNEALITQGSAEEAAQLLWQAARGKEPWAIQEVCRRFAPQTQSLHLIQEVHDDKFDYSKFTDAQLQQLDAIFEQAGAEPPSPEDGEGQKNAA